MSTSSPLLPSHRNRFAGVGLPVTSVFDPGQQQLLDAHDRRDGGHVVGMRGPPGGPLPVRLGDRVEVHHSQTLRPAPRA